MSLKKLLFFSILISFSVAVHAQFPYRLLIKGGHVIDAKNSIDDVMDIAIQNNKIVRVARNIDTLMAQQVIYAKDRYVTPGLIFMVLIRIVI